MTYEFEGKTEREAIDIAVAELGLETDKFDVEILEIQKNSLFKKGYAKIKVHVDDNLRTAKTSQIPEEEQQSDFSDTDTTEVAEKVKVFIQTLLEKTGLDGSVALLTAEKKSFSYKISSDEAPLIIGKKGKNLDAIQFLANVYNSSVGNPHTRILIDCENYKIKREETLVRMAYDVADKVRMSKRSKLLDPLNPYERRIIHSTLNDINDIETKSEGNGLYKQVRVFYRGI